MLSVAFFLGIFGFLGWSSSAGNAVFFSKIEEYPAWVGGVLVIWILFAAIGWRILWGRKATPSDDSRLARWIVGGFIFLIGFGPFLSGKWGGGSLPGGWDELEAAAGWPWIKQFAVNTVPVSNLGLSIGQGLIVAAIALGTFALRGGELFPFSRKYPRGAEAARSLFGFLWLYNSSLRLLTTTGRVLSERVSSPLWEKGLPALETRIFRLLQVAGRAIERRVDILTSDRYGKLISAPSKLAQWFHGGNVRLYGWFALIWILIFSIYLTR